MSAQLSLRSLSPEQPQRIEHYGGYAFGWLAKAEQRNCLPWVRAVVTTPKWAEKVARETPSDIPVMLDNGAYPAFRDGLTPSEHSAASTWRKMSEAAEVLGDRIKWVIYPDVVGNACLTWKRIERSCRSLHWPFPRSKCLVPIQEKMCLVGAIRMATRYGGGVFIGGDKRSWKFQTAKRLRALAPDLHIHIARISSDDHIEHARWMGASSFDTTTYYYGMGSAKRSDFATRLKRHCKRRPLTKEQVARICYYPD
ncbi:MAG: hypothetical protein ACLFVJ_16940 [Persicimonas sp.]